MQKKQIPHVSLIIPCYNESQRITAGLVGAVAYLQKQRYVWEIVLVDDGSTDTTVLLAKRLLKGKPHQLLTHTINQGKGAAIRDGVKVAGGKFIIFSDVDFSAPISQLPKLLQALERNEVAIGVRRHPKSQVLVHQPKLREFLGHAFTKLTNVLVTPGIYDVTCGFKGFQNKPAKKLFNSLRVGGWAFDAELLFLARKYKFEIVQVPIIWSDNPHTKVHLLTDMPHVVADLFKIRVTDWLGAYK